MARTVKDQRLSSRTARAELGASPKPYYRSLDEGLHLGYRKGKRGGKWVMRFYLGDRKYRVETIGMADDKADADGVAVLNFAEAQRAARERYRELRREAVGVGKETGPYTVADALNDYMENYAIHGKGAHVAQYSVNSRIVPQLGSVNLAQLTTEQIQDWLNDLAGSPARLRSRPGEEPNYKDAKDDPEAGRRRKATANRVYAILRAALNHAWRIGKVASPNAWRRVEPFKETNAARVRHLTIDECRRLVNAAEANLRDLVRAGLLTGARYGELTALNASDFNPDSGTLYVRHSKSGKDRHVVLTEEGLAFFERLVAGRPGDAPMLPKRDDTRWLRAHQARPLREACERAGIKPPIGFHVLRHTYASLAVMNGAPLMVVAKTLGHSDARMVEKHYGHLTDDFIAEVIRDTAPRFGIVEESSVRILKPRRARSGNH